nr:integrase, catalytic region, zinc finger, CCHC-type, peptidase aspartic, catalytic [Tanacetum cinerariifolium]
LIPSFDSVLRASASLENDLATTLKASSRKIIRINKRFNPTALLRALIDKKNVVVTKDVIRRDLHLDDADGVECLPNGEIFAELARMGYQKSPPKLTFYKAFFSVQWKFLIHTLVYMVRNVDSPSKFLMYPQFLQVIINNQVDDLTSHNTKYTSYALTQNVFANMRRVASLPQEQPSLPHKSSMSPLNTLMETCATLSNKGRIDQDVSAATKDVSATEPTVFDDEENMAGYKMEHFRGMTYDKVRPIFEREYKKVQTLFKPDKDVKEPKKKRVAEETLLQESFKKLKAVEVLGSDSTQETQSNYPKEINWEIHSKGSRTYWKIIRVGGITKAYQSFKDMLKGFDKENLVALWSLVKEKFSLAVPNVDKEKALWIELKRLFEPNADDVLWKLQRYDMFMLTEKDYPLSNEVMTLMLSAKLQVEEDSEMARDLVMKIFMEAKNQRAKGDSHKFVHELEQEMHADLKYVESLKKAIDELESEKVEFSDMYDVILHDCVYKDVMCSYLQPLSDLDALAELECMYLHKGKGKSVDTKFDRPSVVRQPNAQRIPKPSVLGKPTPFSNSLDTIYFQKTESVPKANVFEGLSKPVTAHTLPQTAKKAVSNTNVLKPGMFQRPSPMLATGRYVQWQSRFMRYNDTRPNLHAVEATDNSPTVAEHTTVETPANMSPENKARFLAEKEAIHLILTGIRDHIYSTVDACQIAQEMWEVIERSQTTTRHKGKKIAKPITPPSETAFEEDSDPEQAQRDKDMQKNLALIAKEKVRSQVVQKTGIQCFNCKEYGHFAKECKKLKRVKDSAYHKEKMLLCKQAEQGVPLQAEHYDWLADTDEEVDEQELEAHYSYMAKIHEVPTIDSGTDSELVEHVYNNAGYNVFSNHPQHSEQSKSVSNTCLVEMDESNVTPDSPDMCEDDIQNEQNDVESDDERVALANLIANLKLNDEFEKFKTFNDRTIDYDKLKRKLNEALGQLAHKDTFALILGYGYLVQRNVTINRVYYVESLNHILFLVGQFCDADLEVAFRKSTCFVRDLQGNDLLNGNHGSDLYTISLQESTSSTPLCLMAKATPTQAWLWHRRLSHLNFDYINLLSKKDIVIGLPKLKFVKDQLCSSCEMSKAKRSSFKSNAIPSSKRRLNLLHMDLCGPMRVASINGKKYIMVIVDDYSRYTWTLFLHSKDETPEIDGENSDKMKEKGDQCILVGYSTQSKGYRVYNKRTRMIVESIHILFDEIKKVSKTSVANNTPGLVPQRQKASDYNNPDPVPQRKDVYSSVDADVPSQQELDMLFGLLYDEFFNTGSNPSMNIQSTSAPSTHTNVYAEENNNDQAEEGEHLPDDEFTNSFCTP